MQFDQSISNGGISEDCLHLSIWAPDLGPQAKRAVIFNIHGGGFGAGSGNLPLYDGSNLAVRGNVVVVSVTHRLHAFGFVDLKAAGVEGDVEDAGVAGLLDLVKALEWVRDNISSFGGDPARVTLLGQSGGGWKISALMAMSVSKSLFHRAVVQSGSRLTLPNKISAENVSSTFVIELGTKDANQIRALPWSKVLAAATKVGLALFEPVLDESYFSAQPVDAYGLSADVPMIISTTLDDASFLSADVELTEDGLRAVLQKRYPDHADEMLQLYRAHRPGKTPFLLLGEIVTDAGFRRFAHHQAERRAALGAAPVYVYQWCWTSPALAGAYGALHVCDVPASFYNMHDAILVGASREAEPLADYLSSSLVEFAQTGVPKASGSLAWPSFSSVERKTLVLDKNIDVVGDPDHNIRDFWQRVPMASSVFG